MKDMSLEELLDDLCFYADLSDEHYKIQDELLRRFESLEKELQATKLAHAVEKQIMQDNFTQCKTVGEYLKTENDNLRCCGNCGKHYKDCQNELSYGYCPRWTTDGMTRGEREK